MDYLNRYVEQQRQNLEQQIIPGLQQHHTAIGQHLTYLEEQQKRAEQAQASNEFIALTRQHFEMMSTSHKLVGGCLAAAAALAEIAGSHPESLGLRPD